MSFLDGLLDLLFPPRCTFCRKILSRRERQICPACVENLPYTRNDFGQTGDGYTLCVSPLYYEGDVRESFHRFKFKEATGYSKVFGQLIAGCIRENLHGCYDLISWVPLSRERLKSRGFDQAMLLALATALELDDVAVETLTKHTDIPAQSGTSSGAERKQNVSGVYSASDPELITGKRILLIDDIITTGATLSECARTLRDSGADDVYCATLARTKLTSAGN